MKRVTAPEAAPWWEALQYPAQLLALGVVALILAWAVWRMVRGPKARLAHDPVTGVALAGVGRKGCRWKVDPVSKGKSMTRWQCMACGVDAYSQDGQRPKECKRGLRDVGL